ncbi:FapA family protein, partial [Aliivibrio sifiae]
AEVLIALEELDMKASMTVVGAYGGRDIQSSDIISALTSMEITRGISRNALKKIMVLSRNLGAGEKIALLVAKGKEPIDGTNASFMPLVEDFREQALQPQEKEGEEDKVDMRDLGETITVIEGDALIRRIPATKGTDGYTVKGEAIAATPGKNIKLRAGKGATISPDDPELVIATTSGMPWINKDGADVDNALCLNAVDISTGHVKFKGSVIVSGDIAADMIVRATGTVTVGGFIESADVQAHGDVIAMKGIIGHQVEEGEEHTCFVKAGGKIVAKFVQSANLQASGDIELGLHSIQSFVKSKNAVTVMDKSGRTGSIVGGEVYAGSTITTVNLGATAGTQTLVKAFTRFDKYKENIADLNAKYKAAQENTMKVVRAEMDLAKVPKAERTPEQIERVQTMKEESNKEITLSMTRFQSAEEELRKQLSENVVKVTERMYPKVIIQYADEQVTTKREHSPCKVYF